MKIFSFGFLFLFIFPLWGQTPEKPAPEYIKTIEFRGASALSGLPVIKLGQGISLAFDDLVGDEADYYYKISYYNWDWTPSKLSKNEYMEGFDNMRIKNFKNSRNTLQIYTHYQLSLPNKDMKGLKVSGNYILGIYDKKDQLIFSKRFIVYENLADVAITIKRAQNLKFINTDQVIHFSVSSREASPLQNPDKNIKPVLYRNGDIKQSLKGMKPEYRVGNKLVYKYDAKLSFKGGNEFLNFDSKDIHSPTGNIRKIKLNKIYNVYLLPDYPGRDKGYVYNPDINGAFKINTLQGEDKNTESEYLWVHFNFKNELPLKKGDEIHVFGGFNNFSINSDTELTYNPEKDIFEGKLLLKQGFYNYKYILRKANGSTDLGYFSGDYDKTENQYEVLIYYTDPMLRYDRLIGRGTANSKNITD